MKYFLYGEVSLKKAIDGARIEVDTLKTFSCTLDERWVYKRAPGAQDEEQQGRPGVLGPFGRFGSAGRAGPGREEPGAPLAAAAGERGDKAAPAGPGGAGMGPRCAGPPPPGSAPSTARAPSPSSVPPVPNLVLLFWLEFSAAAAGGDWDAPSRAR